MASRTIKYYSGNDSNITINPKPTTYNTGDTITLTFTPPSDKQFKTQPYAQYTGSSWGTEETSAIDGVLTLPQISEIYSTDITIYATSAMLEDKPITETYTVTLNKNLTQCKISPVDDTINYTVGTSNILTITPNTNCEFKSIPIIVINDITTEFTKNNDNYEIDLNNLSITSNVTGTITSICDYIEDLIEIDTSNMQNVSFTETSKTTFNKTLYSTTSIEIQANNGYSMDGTPQLIIVNDTGSYPENFIFNETDNTWKITDLVNYYSNITKVYISATAIKETQIVSDYQFIKVYKTDKTIINALRKVRFYNFAEKQYEDLGQYILSFVRYPFSIETTETSKIVLGFFESEIDSSIIDTQLFTLSLGKHLINGIYKNENDVNSCKITANLKYYGLLSIDSKYINTEIEIKYITDILANKTSIEIYSNNVLINRVNCSIGFEIPYILETDRPKAYNDFSNNVKTLENIESIIIVEQNKNASENFNSNKYVSLNDLSNYNEIEKLEINVSKNMTLNEIEQIKTQLQNGIIF